MFDWTLIRKAMQEGVVVVTFKKANGTLRIMQCTLSACLMPETTQSSTHTAGETQIVFDLEAEAWRSFRFDRVTNVELL